MVLIRTVMRWLPVHELPSAPGALVSRLRRREIGLS
jgi:hypothetical protein